MAYAHPDARLDVVNTEVSVMNDSEEQEEEEEEEEQEQEQGDYELSSSPSIAESEIDFSLVYALHTFTPTQSGHANAIKGDQMVLLDDSNEYWWLVRMVKDASIGYLPAENVETPAERLARLNKYRNVSEQNVTVTVLSKLMSIKDRSHDLKRKRKSVAFTHPTFYDPVGYLDDSEEYEASVESEESDESDESDDEPFMIPVAEPANPLAADNNDEEDTTLISVQTDNVQVIVVPVDPTLSSPITQDSSIEVTIGLVAVPQPAFAESSQVHSDPLDDAEIKQIISGMAQHSDDSEPEQEPEHKHEPIAVEIHHQSPEPIPQTTTPVTAEEIPLEITQSHTRSLFSLRSDISSRQSRHSTDSDRPKRKSSLLNTKSSLDKLSLRYRLNSGVSSLFRTKKREVYDPTPAQMTELATPSICSDASTAIMHPFALDSPDSTLDPSSISSPRSPSPDSVSLQASYTNPKPISFTLEAHVDDIASRLDDLLDIFYDMRVPTQI
ncbi:hypothetical protein V1512DRAFT_274147 [Lipomyces arxii]|uniref:uncharacterized protein n=1 Tax=Lipomyces arxii TaxID=56418 RepID=UPI0034CE0426